jgi:hypothetical protein
MRANYQAHANVTVPKRRQQEKWQSTSGTFNGSTTTKSDYVQFALPPHYVRHVAPYTKSEAKMEGLSTQAEDYKKWDVTQVPTRRKTTQAAASSQEDR